MTTTVPTVLLALGALAAFVIVVVVFRAAPRGGFLVWASALFLVPIWVGATLGPHWPAIVLVTILLMIANWSRVTFHPADAFMATFGIVVLVLLVPGEVGLGAAIVLFVEWMIPYIWGRLVLARVEAFWVSSAIGIAALMAAVLAIVEFFTSFNFFITIPGSEPLHSAWKSLQPRGGVLRAEGAFGHSIALGSTLAMSSAFVVHSPWRALTKILTISVIVTAVVMTFSRAAQITIVLTLVASIVLLPGLSQRFRAAVIALGVLGAGIAFPVIESVLGAAGDEAAGSAGYRTDLLILLQQARLFGDAGEWQDLIDGDYYLGYFADSVDNALVLALLRYGIVPTLLMVMVIVSPVATLLRRHQRNPAAVAVACQLPSLVVVALITQYGVAMWFCIGLGVAWGVAAPRDGLPKQAAQPSEGDSRSNDVSSPPGAPDR